MPCLSRGCVDLRFRSPTRTYPPEEKGNDPIGDPTPTAHAMSQEVGLKLNTADGRFSGSLAFYHDVGKNEQYVISSTIESDINPSGLNGRFGGSPAAFVYVDRSSTGVNMVLTAKSDSQLAAALQRGRCRRKNWHRNRLQPALQRSVQRECPGAGDLCGRHGGLRCAHLQFEGADVDRQHRRVRVPLTVALMNNPSSVYYANPLIRKRRQISTASAVYTVLKTVDPPCTDRSPPARWVCPFRACKSLRHLPFPARLG